VSFYETLTEAVKDFTENGYDDPQRLADWMLRLREAANADLPSPSELERRMKIAMEAVYKRSTSFGSVTRRHPSISRLTIDAIEPSLRPELTRRILASADLIKLNREQAIDKTLQRFSGWATSVPAGGSRIVDKVDIKADISKSLKQVKFEQRRMEIDQGHKLMASIDAVIAQDTGAIAAKWRDRGSIDKTYNARHSHLARDSKIYAIRGNWAMGKGLMNKGAGYTDEMTAPGEEVFCLPGDSTIPFADGVEITYRRWFDGELAVLTTASGKTIRATLNHPILTAHGWIAAGSLKEGDDVIEISNDVINSVMTKTDDDGAIPSISQVFDSINVIGNVSRISGSGHQFHGDGQKGYVDIVRAARPLSFGIKAAGPQGFKNFDFTFPYLRAFTQGTQNLGFNRIMRPSSSFMRSLCSSFALFWSLIQGNELVGAQLVSADSAGSKNDFFYGSSANAKFLGKRRNAFAIRMPFIKQRAIKVKNTLLGQGRSFKKALFVKESFGDAKVIRNTLDSFSLCTHLGKIVKADRIGFAGHVFNLQTREGWYVADGIVTHNCSCYYVYLNNLRDLPEDMLTAKGKKILEETRIK
jgi:intein/homing endonuclease